MTSRKVLVTGATGLVGRSLLRALDAAGYGAHGTYRTAELPVGDLPEAVAWFRASIEDEDGLRRAADGCDIAVHLVGILAETPSRGITHERITVRGTANALEAARGAGVQRFLYVSAAGTHPGATSQYHRAKWQAESLVREGGMPWTIFRPSMLFGPEGRPGEPGFVRDFVTELADVQRRMPLVVIPGSGRASWQPLWVGDLARAVVDAIDREEMSGRTIEAGGPHTHHYGKLIREIYRAQGLSKPVIRLPRSLLGLLAALYFERKDPPLLTRDQLQMLAEDNVAADDTFARLLNEPLRKWEEGLKGYFQSPEPL